PWLPPAPPARRRRHERRPHDLFTRRARGFRALRVRLDAVRALSRARNRDSDQLPVFPRNRSVTLDDLVEVQPGVEVGRRQRLHFLQQPHVRGVVEVLAHLVAPCCAGSILRTAPSSMSVSTYNNPSGPCRISRIRWRRSTSSDSRRISSIFSLNMIRSTWPVPGISPVRRPPTNTSPFHFGRRSPV